MTTDEKIDKILKICGKIEPMVEEHHRTLYGNGQPGLSKDVIVLQQRQEDCPARKATTAEGKKLNIATIAIIIASVSCVSSIILGAITVFGK